MNTAVDPIGDLARYLTAQTPGPLDPAPLVPLLARAWSDLGGDSEESTWSSKLSRIEDPVWEPPILRFDLERHGATVLGSTRAAVHTWRVDVARRTASIEESRRRQVTKMDKRLDAKALPDELLSLIESGADDPRLVWNQDRSEARVVISKAVPMTFKQTTEGRRKRFTDALLERAVARGWPEGGGYTFARTKGPRPSPRNSTEVDPG